MTSHSDGLRRLRNFINGEYVDSVDGRTAPVVNPATGEAYAEAPVSTAEDVDRAFRA
ncbi:MAG UNVERIFIED_CONTAM: gamma-aminobutyraldehyde dehydrogenase, partial [Thermobifida fusca]